MSITPQQAQDIVIYGTFAMLLFILLIISILIVIQRRKNNKLRKELEELRAKELPKVGQIMASMNA